MQFLEGNPRFRRSIESIGERGGKGTSPQHWHGKQWASGEELCNKLWIETIFGSVTSLCVWQQPNYFTFPVPFSPSYDGNVSCSRFAWFQHRRASGFLGPSGTTATKYYLIITEITERRPGPSTSLEIEGNNEEANHKMSVTFTRKERSSALKYLGLLPFVHPFPSCHTFCIASSFLYISWHPAAKIYMCHSPLQHAHCYKLPLWSCFHGNGS